MGFVYEEEKLELKVGDKVYPFTTPSAKQQQLTSLKFRNADDNTDAVDLYIEFFESLGLPKEVLEKMSMKGLTDLFSYALGSKKN